MNLYFDNSATSYPKPKEVYEAMNNYMTNIGASPGRGAYGPAIEADRIVYTCREELCDLFNFDKPENVIFTPNITYALNILIKSTIKKGWHVITTSMEHNSVLRPLTTLRNNLDFELDIIQCSTDGYLDTDVLKSHIKSNTKMIILSHASNIIGTLQPLKDIGNICKINGIYLIIDTAQTAGVIPIDFKEINCSALTFTGHKGLLGPQGIGGFLITDELNQEAATYIEGGTGSYSFDTNQPNILPDKFESGTLNTPGITGLLAGLKFIKDVGVNSIKEYENELTKLFISSISNINKLTIYSHKENRVASISINYSNYDPSEIAFSLYNEFKICVRSGLHCAPLAHKTIGTYPNGTIRFSFGFFNNKDDINYCVDSLYNIIKSM